MVTKRSFFDDLAARWDAKQPGDMAERLARVVALSGVGAGSRVLDVGTGTGVLVPHLLAAVGPAGSVVGIDTSAGMLAEAKRKGFPPCVSFVQADVHSAAMPNEAFDAVFCNAVFPHFEDGVRALGELRRLLVSQGLLVISHPIGREGVNRVHRNAGGAVAEDVLPSNEQLEALLRSAGYGEVEVVDEPGFHFVRCRRV